MASLLQHLVPSCAYCSLAPDGDKGGALVSAPQPKVVIQVRGVQPALGPLSVIDPPQRHHQRRQLPKFDSHALERHRQPPGLAARLLRRHRHAAGFDAHLQGQAEQLQLCAVLHRAGFRVDVLEVALVLHAAAALVGYAPPQRQRLILVHPRPCCRCRCCCCRCCPRFRLCLYRCWHVSGATRDLRERGANGTLLLGARRRRLERRARVKQAPLPRQLRRECRVLGGIDRL
mmetsp:Transcript_2244/g.5022  ORF Transcript_2244/g.5022 Transcript_2244/m.5022 type:complete len:231 (+) Transcript_2244:61-753(+)